MWSSGFGLLVVLCASLCVFGLFCLGVWWVSGFGRVLFFVFGFWLGFVFWWVAGVLFFVGRVCAGLVGGLFLLVVWVVFVCWGWVVASYFFGAILFVLIVVGLSGFLLASAFCLVLQPVFWVLVLSVRCVLYVWSFCSWCWWSCGYW